LLSSPEPRFGRIDGVVNTPFRIPTVLLRDKGVEERWLTKSTGKMKMFPFDEIVALWLIWKYYIRHEGFNI